MRTIICGLLGYSEKLCGQLFDTSENEIVKSYGTWMRAPFRGRAKLIGARWLHNGNEGDRWNVMEKNDVVQSQLSIGGLNHDTKFVPQN